MKPLFPWFIILASIWAPVIYLLGAQWSVYDQYNYGWAVPFLCLVLAAARKPKIEAGRSKFGGTEGSQPSSILHPPSSILAPAPAPASPKPRAGGLASPEPCAGGLASPKPRVGGPSSIIHPLSSLLASAPAPASPKPGVGGPTSDLRPPISTPLSEVRRPVVWSLLVTSALAYWLMRILQEANPIWRLASYGLALSAVAMTLLLVYLTQGRARMMQFIFPVAFFLVAVPWPTPVEQAVIQTLTRLNSGLVVEILGFLGIPALLHGNVIEISTGLVGFDEACSGIRSLQATIMIALFFGAFYRLTGARRLWLLLAGPALALAFNFTRTLTLVLVASHAGLPAMEKWHDPTGVALLLGCFLSLWFVSLFLAAKPGMDDRRSMIDDRGERAGELKQGGDDDGGKMIDDGRSKLGGTEGSQSSAILHPPSSILASAPRAPAPRAPEPRAGGLAAPERSLGGLTSDLRSPISAHPSSLNYPPSSILATAPSTPEPAVGGLASPKARVGGPSSILHPLSSILPAALALWALTVALSTEAWFRSHEARGHDALSWTAQWPTTNPTLRTNAIPPMALRMLQCDENSSANWSDDAGVFWQAFCLRWLPADTFYGRTKVALSKSHNPTICLTAAGMTLKTQLDPVTLPVRTDPDTGLGLNLNLSLTFDRFVFEANGRDLFVFFSQTEDMTDAGQANLRTTHLARLRAALTGSRNYGERNFEVALTGPATPAAALAFFQAHLPELVEVKPKMEDGK